MVVSAESVSVFSSAARVEVTKVLEVLRALVLDALVLLLIETRELVLEVSFDVIWVAFTAVVVTFCDKEDDTEVEVLDVVFFSEEEEEEVVVVAVVLEDEVADEDDAEDVENSEADDDDDDGPSESATVPPLTSLSKSATASSYLPYTLPSLASIESEVPSVPEYEYSEPVE